MAFARRAPRLLLLGFGVLQPQYVLAAHRRGLAVAVVDLRSNVESPELAAVLDPGDRVFPLERKSEHALLRAAARAVRDQRPVAVVADSETEVIAAAFLADQLGLRGPGLRAAVASRDKSLQRAVFEQAELPQPAFHLADNADDAERWACVRYPVVVKPLDRAGSRGVQLVDAAVDLRAWAAKWPRPFLVEEYVAAPEYSCEIVVRAGTPVFLSLTEKTTCWPPRFVELEHVVPAARPAEQVARLAERMAAALGVDAGILHLEVRLGRDAAWIMEVAVRAGGDFILEATELALGIDAFDAHVGALLGEETTLEPSRSRVAGVRFFTPPPGRVEAIDGIDEARLLPGVRRVALWVEPGATVRPLEGSYDRAGAVVVEAATRAALRERLDAVTETLRIRTATGSRKPS